MGWWGREGGKLGGSGKVGAWKSGWVTARPGVEHDPNRDFDHGVEGRSRGGSGIVGG